MTPHDYVKAAEVEPVKFDESTEHLYNGMSQALGAATMTRAVNELISGDGIDPCHIEEWASQVDVEPGEIAQDPSALMDAFSDQFHQPVAAMGLDPEALQEWASSNAKGDLGKALQQHWQTRSRRLHTTAS